MESMYTELTTEKRNSLVLQLKTERDKRVAYRINAVLLSDEGWSLMQIARALFLDEETIRRYLSAYEEESRLSPQHKGSKPFLTEMESETLSAHLESQIYVKIKDTQAYVRELLCQLHIAKADNSQRQLWIRMEVKDVVK